MLRISSWTTFFSSLKVSLGNGRPADDVGEDVGELLEMLLENLRVVAGRFLPRERVVLAADRLEVVGDREGVAALRSAKDDVLEEMREPALRLFLAARASRDPDAEGDRRRKRIPLMEKRRSRRESHLVRTRAASACDAARAEPCGSA